jgi:VCBS repeat-containing protein
MTPVDLVPGAVDETNDTVTNIARFLQTLDVDADLSNGIQIPEGAAEAAAGLSVNFAQTPEAFENDPNVQAVLAALTTNPLVSAADAQSELQNTILTQLAGDYGGSFTGDASGCWAFQVDDSGAVTGTFDIESTEFTGEVTVALIGSIPSSGNFTLTGSMPPFMLTIMGTVTTDGDATGTWTLMNNGSPVGSGAFTGGEGQACEGNGNGNGDSNCPNNAVRFVFTPLDGPPFTVDTCASFECQTPVGGNCALQVFDIAGSDRFLQFSTTTAPFMVNFNFCGGFDFVIDEPGASGPGAGRGLSSAFGDLTGRQFGEQITTPFAAGDYAYRDDQLSGGGGESLGTFEFFEPGFMGFELPNRPCPE